MQMKSNKLIYFLMLPAILIGSIAMVHEGVATGIWVQNIITWIIGCILGNFYLKRKFTGNSNELLAMILIVIVLLLTLFTQGLVGVHRWLVLGPIRFYIASIFLPLAIIYLYKLIDNYSLTYSLSFVFVILVILLFQPDAGQMTSFALAVLPLIYRKVDLKVVKYLSILVMVSFVSLSWIYIDSLAPVAHVEGILLLVKDLGMFWFILGFVSLVLLLMPFFFSRKKSLVCFSLGIYYLAQMLVTFYGNFPMPIMGYGISPIIGYMIAITFVIKHKKTHSRVG